MLLETQMRASLLVCQDSLLVTRLWAVGCLMSSVDSHQMAHQKLVAQVPYHHFQWISWSVPQRPSVVVQLTMIATCRWQ